MGKGSHEEQAENERKRLEEIQRKWAEDQVKDANPDDAK